MNVPQNFADNEAWRYSVKLWHPNCWSIQTTQQVDVGLLSHGCFRQMGDQVASLFTIYADSIDVVDRGQEIIENFNVVSDIVELDRKYRGSLPQPGNAIRELLITTEGATHISDVFTDRGFIPIQADIRDGQEEWTLLLGHGQQRARELFDEVSTIANADISVLSVTPAGHNAANLLPLDQLTSRQREVFRLAQSGGYYEHPREMTIENLANQLGVSTSTAHEHLRKAEAALLHQKQGGQSYTNLIDGQ